VDGPLLARDNLACRSEVACGHVSGPLMQPKPTAGPDRVREPRPHHSNEIKTSLREHFERALGEQEVLLNHAGCADREQHRTATASGNRLDHHIGIEAGSEAECDRLADGRGVDGNQQIVD
jgi:hypothetical protein